MHEIVLVRHGETEGESSIRLNGITDVGLDEVGRLQMRRVGEHLRHGRFDRVVTSPLRRCRDAIELVAPSGPPATVVEDLREIDFGRWETWTHAEARARDPEVYARWQVEGPSFRFPDGDSRDGFRRRVVAATERVLAQPDGRVLAVLHKGVIKVILGHLLGLPYEEWTTAPMDLGGIHRLRHDASGWQLTEKNRTEHLGELVVPDGAHKPR